MSMKRMRFESAMVVFAFAAVVPASAIAQAQGTDDGESRELDLEQGSPAGGDVATPPAPSDVKPLSGYDKGFFVRDAEGRFSTKVQLRVQGRYTFEMLTDADEYDQSKFTVQRARLSLGGNAFGKELKYKFQLDFGRGNADLKDFFFDYELGEDILLRVGQWKKPFSRQQINSSGRLAFVDRSITDRAFNAGRDVGIGVHNNFDKSPEIEWALGVFNGFGEGGDPERFFPVVVARAGYSFGGIKGYREADLEGGPLRFGVGASAMINFDLDSVDTGDDNMPYADFDDSAIQAEIDYILKVDGFSTTGGFYVATGQDGDGFFAQAPQAYGFHAQAGYMLADQHQIAARYAQTLFAGDTGDQEILLGYSLYRSGHGLKWQTDIGTLTPQGMDIGDDVRMRTQVQLSF